MNDTLLSKIIEINENCRYALNHFGEEKQIEKAIEELKELLFVLEQNKDMVFHRDLKEKILEEGADVLNMVNQLFMIFDLDSEAVTNKMFAKMRRTLIRIKAEKQEESREEKPLIIGRAGENIKEGDIVYMSEKGLFCVNRM